MVEIQHLEWLLSLPGDIRVQSHTCKVRCRFAYSAVCSGMCQAHKTVVVGDGTDLLVLLLYHTEETSKDIFFQPELKKMNDKKQKKKRRIWNIKRAKTRLGAPIYNNLLFVHALLGRDTTSRVFIGKGLTLKKLIIK